MTLLRILKVIDILQLKCHLIEILAIRPCFLKLLFVGRDKVLDFIKDLVKFKIIENKW